MGTDGQLAKPEWDEFVSYVMKAKQAEIDRHRTVAKSRVLLTAKKLETVLAFARKDCTDPRKLKKFEVNVKKLQADLQVVEDTFFDELSYKTQREWQDALAFCELAGCAPEEVQANADLGKILVEDETIVAALRHESEVEEVADDDEDDEDEDDDEEEDEDEDEDEPIQSRSATPVQAPSVRAPVIDLEQRRERKTIPPPAPPSVPPAPPVAAKSLVTLPKKVVEQLPRLPEGMDVAIDFFPPNPAGGARRNELSLAQRQNVLDVLSDRSVSGIRVQTLGESCETRLTSDSAQRMLKTWLLLLVSQGYLSILNPEEKGWKFVPGERFAEARRKIRMVIDRQDTAQEA